MMYTYESWIDAKTYEKLEVNEKEQAMLQGVVLEEQIEYPKTKLKFDYKVISNWKNISKYIREIQLDDTKFELTENGIIVKDYTCFALPVPNTKGEWYVRLKGAEYISKNVNHTDNWKTTEATGINVYMEDRNDACTLTNSTYEYYMGERDFLLNLGYGTGSGVVYIDFTSIGEYRFSDMEILCQSMERYALQVEALIKTPITDILLNTNSITGKINTADEKLVCVTIPFSDGWSAYVNGKETKISPANGMFMAVKVPPGNNNIDFKYHTKGLLTGTIISCSAFLVVICLLVFKKVMKNRLMRKKQTNYF